MRCRGLALEEVSVLVPSRWLLAFSGSLPGEIRAMVPCFGRRNLKRPVKPFQTKPSPPRILNSIEKIDREAMTNEPMKVDTKYLGV
jgi:hypothetical protein